MQAAQKLVELEQARGDTGQLADAMVGRLGGDCRLGQRRPEGLEAALDLAGTGEVVQLLFGQLNLLQGHFVDVRAEGSVDHAFADIDQLPAQIEVMHGTAEGRRIDDMDRRCDQARQVGRAAGRLHVLVLFDVGLERDGAHDLAALDESGQRIEQLAM